MRQTLPSLDVYLPVQNIGQSQMARLELAVMEGEDPSRVTPKVLHEVLRPARLPRAKILTAEEIASFHQAVGLEDIDESGMEQVGIYLKGALGSFLSGEPLVVPTMPPGIEPLDDGLIVRVAASPQVIELRHLAWNSLAAVHHVQEIPDEVRLDDELATGVWAGQSNGPATNRLARKLYVALSCDDEILEPRTVMSGQAEIELALQT